MSRPKPALQIAFLAAAAALASGASAATPQRCAARTIGPGTRLHGGTAGATCMLAAFHDGCRAATYTLSAYGVDTAHVETFTTRRLAGSRCGVVVVETARVIPQPAHVLSRRTCTRLRKTSTGVVADRCTKPATISLTKLG
jgi:hypothetical protein